MMSAARLFSAWARLGHGEAELKIYFHGKKGNAMNIYIYIYVYMYIYI